MMVLGILNPDVFAFVYNDFLCRTLERAKTMTMPNGRGVRSAPNSIRHLIPGFWKQFDFPDIVAALAPRPVICTEGGLDRDFRLISAAYRMAGAPDHFRYHHQPRFADPAQRWNGSRLPAGLDRDAFSASSTWIPATTSSKKTWSFPGLKAFWIKAIIKTKPSSKQKPPGTAGTGHSLILRDANLSGGTSSGTHAPAFRKSPSPPGRPFPRS